MQIPAILEGESLTRLLQGAFLGAIGTIGVGFGWAGWMLGSTSAKLVEDGSKSAVVAALAPICVARFQVVADANATLVKLKAVESWRQGDFVAKGGWATFDGAKEPNSDVASACAKLLMAVK